MEEQLKDLQVRSYQDLMGGGLAEQTCMWGFSIVIVVVKTCNGTYIT